MIWLGGILLAAGALILGATNPWKFFEATEGSFFDWTETFWYFQWAGFWMVAASAAVFTIRWKIVPLAIAVTLLMLFFVFSMPEKSNERDWKHGWLGARVYWRTKLWNRDDDKDEQGIPDRLVGRWESIAISRSEVRIGEVIWNRNRCRRFEMNYDFAYRSSLEQPATTGLRFARFGSAAALSLPDRRFPRLWCSCDGDAASFVLIDLDRLVRTDLSAMQFFRRST